jgi:aryl-alcohol dehydrogenase-like predicted oxidoreductase
MKLGLGTVQWGMPYGISNNLGVPAEQEAKAMLAFAQANKIELLDTAPGYGEAENVLGRLAASDFKIITKTAKLTPSTSPKQTKGFVLKEFHSSLLRLGLQRAYGLLVHSLDDLFGPSGDLLWETMQEIRQLGLAERIGVSVYSIHDIERIWERLDFNIIQLPMNVLDQRLAGWIGKLRSAGVEIHVRSAFLQGALLMNSEQLPSHFGTARQTIADFQRDCAANGLTPLAGALGFFKTIEAIDYLIVGAVSVKQIAEIHRAFFAESVLPNYATYNCSDEFVINPSLWGQRNHAH